MKTTILSFVSLLLTGLLLAAVLAPSTAGRAEPDSSPWFVESWEDLALQATAHRRPYYPFLERPTFSAGIYQLPAGGADGHRRHPRDELDFVLDGRAIFVSEGGEQPVEPGTVLFVGAGVDHYFRAIEEDLTVLVLFSREAAVEIEVDR